MLNKTIRVELRSDLCPGSGNGFAGYVDTDVCFDDLGLPYIPAKRLKGCLRECGLDILSVDDVYSGKFNRLFGETGKLVPGELSIENGRIEDYERIASEFGSAHRSELAEVYTSIRSRTKMEGGKAARGTLRNSRVLNRNQFFEFPVSLSEETLDFFEMCVKSLRGMGLNRSRGLGEVKCEIRDGKPQKGMKFNITDFMGEKSFAYRLDLLEPVISADRSGKPLDTEDYIFGSAVLGAFAVKYIEKYGLSRENAYTDDTFRRVFLEGSVKFTAAMPCKDGVVYRPSPMFLKTDKLNTRLSDESSGIPKETDEDNPICKRLGGFISVKNNIVSRYSPEKTAFPHHARPDDKSKGHAGEERAYGSSTSDTGAFYTYEALSEGQVFAGRVIGNETDIRVLAELFADNEGNPGTDVLHIGRSRTAQYGNVKIASVDEAMDTGSLELRDGDMFRLIAVTPIILENKDGINTTDIGTLTEILGSDYELIRFSCAETTIAGYYGKWLLPRRQERALAEGSVAVFKYKGPGATLGLGFIGKRTGEGFGQIKLDLVMGSASLTLKAEAGDETGKRTLVATDVPIEIAKLRADKEAVSKGTIYGGSASSQPQNTNLSRIQTMLRTAKDFNGFAYMICDIKQPKQKEAALAFTTNKDIWHFKTDKAHLLQPHIVGLLQSAGYDYATYQKYLNAAIQRIKQKRRDNNDTKIQEGGGSDERM